LPPTDLLRQPDAAGARGPAALRIDRATSALLVIDIQARLVPHIADHTALVDRTCALLDAAQRLGVPCIATEHCAQQIGPLVAPIASRLEAERTFAKTRFCATDHAEFRALLSRTARSQIVIAGMEAHVCVMQTALGIVSLGYDVFIVGDAVGSRTDRRADRDLAIARLRAAGCAIAGTETVLFEWMGSGDDPAFRDVLTLVKTLPPPQNLDR
jgi:nicotinamidase-related amidase